jgi:hypothetical protein
MNVRALPHVKHSAIGKSKDPKGTAYNHVNYILREQACSHVRGENMPLDRKGARPYFDERAYREGQPANGRVADTVIIAMPIELTAEQRHDVLEGFMKQIGQGRIAWLAAFHETGDDAHNPHAHLIFRDEDVEKGGKGCRHNDQCQGRPGGRGEWLEGSAAAYQRRVSQTLVRASQQRIRASGHRHPLRSPDPKGARH